MTHDLRRLTFLAPLGVALILTRTARLPKLAQALPTNPDPRSGYHRIQRFLAWFWF